MRAIDRHCPPAGDVLTQRAFHRARRLCAELHCCGAGSNQAPQRSRSRFGKLLSTRDASAQTFPQTVEIRCAERAIVKSVSRPAGFIPYHSAVIGADRPVEASLDQRPENFTHVDVAELRWMWHFVKIMFAGSLNISAMHEVNEIHCSEPPRHCRQRIVG